MHLILFGDKSFGEISGEIKFRILFEHSTSVSHNACPSPALFANAEELKEEIIAVATINSHCDMFIVDRYQAMYLCSVADSNEGLPLVYFFKKKKTFDEFVSSLFQDINEKALI